LGVEEEVLGEAEGLWVGPPSERGGGVVEGTIDEGR
jgi:hypothetical protein